MIAIASFLLHATGMLDAGTSATVAHRRLSFCNGCEPTAKQQNEAHQSCQKKTHVKQEIGPIPKKVNSDFVALTEIVRSQQLCSAENCPIYFAQKSELSDIIWLWKA